MNLDALVTQRAVHPRVRAAALAALPALERRPHGTPAFARVFAAFEAEGVNESDLWGTTGYGYDDAARERYESLLARVLCAERALARLSIVSGTHAIVVSLGALLTPGTTLVCAGRPYDTLRNAIVDAPGSLASTGVTYREASLDGGDLDPEALADAVRTHEPAVVLLQRSRGYATRRTFSIERIEAACRAVRTTGVETVIAVDNCYGELVEDREPLEAGADLVMGSLIKNLGGGLAPTGGYVAGRADLVERVAVRLFAPGLARGLGPTLGMGRILMQGLWYAPLVVAQTLRGLDFAAALFAELGFAVDPQAGAARGDIVQAIRLGDPARLLAFAHGLQRTLPVNARYRPEPGSVPGYRDPVVMSSGAFIAGATSELSCDAPLREPYEVYLQGGIIAEHAVVGAIAAADAVLGEGEPPQRG